MAEGITLKRIIDMDEAAELTSSDYALVDSATGGPKKFAIGQELGEIKDGLDDVIDVISTDKSETGKFVRIDGQSSFPLSVTGYGESESVYVTSANLFDISLIPDRSGLVVNHGTYLTITQNSSGDRVNCLKKLSELCPQLKIGDTVFLKANTTGSLKYVYFNANSSTVYFGQSFVVTQNYLDSYLYFVASGASTSADISNIMVCFSDEDVYEAYNSITYSAGSTKLENAINYIFGSARSVLTVAYKEDAFEQIDARIDGIDSTIHAQKSMTGTLLRMSDAVGGAVISITGASEGDTVYVSGNNLFNADGIPDRAGYITNEGNGVFSVVSAQGTTNTNSLKRFREVVTGVKVGDELTLSFDTTSSDTSPKLYIGDASWNSGTRRTVTETIYNGYIYFVGTSGESYTVSNIQFWFGKTTGTYEPYRTKSYTYGTDSVELEDGFNQMWALSGSNVNDTLALTYVSNVITNVERSAELYTRWNGKKMLVLGDSISADNYLLYPCWADVVALDMGMELINPSVHAVGYLCGVDSQTPNENSLINLIDTLAQTYPNKDDFDLIVFFRGTNDYGNSISIGNTGDTKTASFTGAVEYCFKKAYKTWADARICVLTPMPRRVMTENSAGATLSDYVDCIIDSANKIGFPVLNMYTDSGFNVSKQVFGDYVTIDGTANTDTQLALDYCMYVNGVPDGLHPNQTFTDERIVPMAKAFFNKI